MKTPRLVNTSRAEALAVPPRERRTLLLLGLVTLGLLTARPAHAQEAPGSTPAPATLEASAQPGISRVRLTAQAARRIGLQTVPVRLAAVARTRRVGGEVVAGMTAGAAKASPGPLWVRVPLGDSDLARLNRGLPARVLPLSGDGAALTARLVGAPAKLEEKDVEDTDATPVYYSLNGVHPTLAPGQRVFVEITFGQGARQTVVPYSAVVYDVGGETWVYTNPAPLTYEREEVSVDYIEGDRAILSEGPAPGTAVVSVGTSELYGAETELGK